MAQKIEKITNKTAIVIPSYRCSDKIEQTINGLNEYNFVMILIVDDCCPENCGLIVQNMANKPPNTKVIKTEKNLGVGGAVIFGIEHIIANCSVDFILKIDADGQMDGKDIVKFITFKHSNDETIGLIKGNRFYSVGVLKMPTTRLLGNVVLSILFPVICLKPFGFFDPSCGFWMVRVEAWKRIDKKKLSYRFYFEYSLISEVLIQKYKIRQLEVKTIYEDERSNLKIGQITQTFPAKMLETLGHHIKSKWSNR